MRKPKDFSDPQIIYSSNVGLLIKMKSNKKFRKDTQKWSKDNEQKEERNRGEGGRREEKRQKRGGERGG